VDVREIDCSYVNEHDLVALYLATRLPANDAEAFEAHYFGCERCWQEVRQTGELRSAFGKQFVVIAQPPRITRDFWAPLAAAAVVAVMAFGLIRLTERPNPSPDSRVFRSASANRLDLTVRLGSAGQVILEWSPHPDAGRYRVAVFRSDGLPVLKSETSDLRVSLDLGALPPPPAGIAFLGKVEALDTMGQVVAESDLTSLPGR
jgi:hypothetical protein